MKNQLPIKFKCKFSLFAEEINLQSGCDSSMFGLKFEIRKLLKAVTNHKKLSQIINYKTLLESDITDTCVEP